MKYLRLLAVGLLLGLGLTMVIRLGHGLSGDCGEFYRRDTTVSVNGQNLSAETAASATQQQQGLSGKSCLGANQAMLFTFGKPGYYQFWMKDMRFAIDMVWLDTGKRVVYVKSNVSPATYPQTFVSAKPAKYVLELKAGRASQLKLSPGTPVSF